MELTCSHDSFHLYWRGFYLCHSPVLPILSIGVGQANIQSYRGNYEIEDEVFERRPLHRFSVTKQKNGYLFCFFKEGSEDVLVELSITERDDRLHLQSHCTDTRYNRIWLRIPAEKSEQVFGGGEQFSYYDLRGRRFPIWTSEQGVGRNKRTMTTLLADLHDRAGGDYYSTFFPQPTFISSRLYYCHFHDTCYSCLDFTHSGYHECLFWTPCFSAVLETGRDYSDLLNRLTGLLGKQRMLPEWACRGVWLGIQGGTAEVDRKLNTMLSAGTDVSAVWCQDWAGIRMTSFGQRLYWDWRWNAERYPDLPEKILQWREKGVRFLGYISPNLCVGGKLFNEAEANGFLVKNGSGNTYLLDFGEFDCGFVDLTNPAAFKWYKDVIKTNMIGFGMSGWMADFGEYLPIDCRLFSGESAMELHNKWPVLWARLNREAVAEAGKEGEIVFIMRSGGAGSQKYAPLIWAGDQNVDWSLDDGLASVIPAALSLGMSGHTLHTSDIGGYTTLYGMKRTKELLLRWAEFCVFTLVMRTHEGNRPAENWQFDSDAETVSAFARLSVMHTTLYPYIRDVMYEAQTYGTPVMRALSFHYADVPADRELQYEYLLGPDLLIAPVYKEGAGSRRLYLPSDEWIHLWSDKAFSRGWVEVETPLGKPAVFYRHNSDRSSLFRKLSRAFI